MIVFPHIPVYIIGMLFDTKLQKKVPLPMNELPEFRALGVADELIPALLAKNFVSPSAIQTLTIPALLSGEKDLIGQALTGTGKTAAFGLPVIQTAQPIADVLAGCISIPFIIHFLRKNHEE